MSLFGWVESLSVSEGMAFVMIAMGIAALMTLCFTSITAPYGRYSSLGWGFMLDAKIAWFIQEIWSFLIPVAWLTFFATPAQLERVATPANTILMATFLLHYFYRDLIFPFRIRSGKPTPLVVCLLAAIFCVYNGYMQTFYLLNEAPTDPTAATSPRFLLGISMWTVGWAINLHSDNVLIGLRKPRDKPGTYKIPRGGMFTFVSAANYFGEMIEWLGWAIASWSLPAAAFAIFTFCNLAPRGWRHHLWYRNKFPRYPKHRKAVVPFVL